MINYIIKQRNKNPKLCEIIRFLIVGGISTIIDMLVMAFIIYIPNKHLFVDGFMGVFISGYEVSSLLVITATAIGFITGLIFNYVFSLLYVYDGDNNYAKTKKGFFIFAILSTIGLFIQSFGMFIGYTLMKINQWIVKILLIVIVLSFNYITRKIFIFKKQNQDISQQTDKQKEPTKLKSLILNSIFILSSTALFWLMYNPQTYGIGYSNQLKFIYLFCMIAIISVFLFVFNKNLLLKIDCKNHHIRNAFIVVYTVWFANILLKHTVQPLSLTIVLLLIASFSIFIYNYLLITFTIKFIKSFWNKLNITLKKVFVITIICGILLNSLVVSFTTLFANPGAQYDCFFSFDTGPLLNMDYYGNQFGIENDIRHVLMSLCIMPFAVIPSIISKILWFIPSLDGLLLSFIQVVIIAYVLVTILMYIKVDNNALIILFSILFIGLSGSFYNMLTTEKFVFALFYIIATISMSLEKSPFKWVFFIGAVGVLSTNIFLLPILLFTDKKPIKVWVAEIAFIGLVFLSIVMIFGQFNLLLFSLKAWDRLQGFSTVSTSNPYLYNLKQFLIFISSMIVSPKFTLTTSINQAVPTFNIMAYLGIFIIIISTMGFIFNRKNKYAQICFYWQIFMIFLLVVIGWGSANNEMFIYSAIFTWSTFSLMYLFVDKLITNTKVKIIFLILICGIIIYNAFELIEIIDFSKHIFKHL